MPTQTTDTQKPKRLFILDTNVLLHDPFSMFKFDEHDIFIPFVTIEELDGKKSGTQDVNRNARQATRLLDEVTSQEGCTMESGYPLAGFNGGHATGKLYVQRESINFLPDELIHKNDNLYLAVLTHITADHPDVQVVMVTKDLNLRIKAKALGFHSEDYRHDHAVEDADLLYRGIQQMPEDWLESLGDIESWKEGPHVLYRVPEFSCTYNEFISQPDGRLYQVIGKGDGRVTLQVVTDYRKDRHKVLGINARNDEQQAALALLMDPEVDLVTLLGPAGTGKTLLALAAGLAQISHNDFEEIIFTRATTPLGEDIGFLPGTEEEKMAPWLGALKDNGEVLVDLAEGAAKTEVATLVEEHVKIRAITFMRGRTFHRKYLIIDEAQNLTPKQVKTLVTRAGEGTKMVLLGNLSQIDSPYLSETSSGLAYVVERFKGWEHYGSLILQKGERSRLATEGNERL